MSLWLCGDVNSFLLFFRGFSISVCLLFDGNYAYMTCGIVMSVTKSIGIFLCHSPLQ